MTSCRWKGVFEVFAWLGVWFMQQLPVGCLRYCRIFYHVFNSHLFWKTIVCVGSCNGTTGINMPYMMKVSRGVKSLCHPVQKEFSSDFTCEEWNCIKNNCQKREYILLHCRSLHHQQDEILSSLQSMRDLCWI